MSKITKGGGEMFDSDKCLNILTSDKNLCTILWDFDNGWRMLGKGAFLFVSEEIIAQKGLEFLLDMVSDADRELCRSFLDNLSMLSCTEEAVRHHVVSLHLLSANQQFYYYNVECDILWENKERKTMLCKIRELNPEEIYRIQLAQNITNDKNPSYFANGACEIMKRNPEGKYALIQFDIAKFKLVNDQYGESFGTEILNFILHRLNLLCGKNQLYARLSADLFMIFTPYETVQDIYDLIEDIIQNMSSYKCAHYRLDFGVCPIADINSSLRIYGDNAALARKSIKNNALTHVAFFDEKLKQDVRNRKFMEDQMEDALENGEFVMFLQPKYSISQNRMIGAEALVRWIHPERGMIQPMEFIPLFEQNNFIIKVDYYIWEQACKTIRDWIDAGVTPIPISVNMSQKHLYNQDFVRVLSDLIDKYQIDKKYLEIEITETANGPDVVNSVNLLKQSGYTLLMDDFGSGYSTFGSLKDTQFDILKIDRSLLQDFIGSKRGEKIVEHIIKMVQSIGLDLIAEGVENQEQTIFLSKCGCDKVQGYYYAKPMSLETFNENRD